MGYHFLRKRGSQIHKMTTGIVCLLKFKKTNINTILAYLGGKVCLGASVMGGIIKFLLPKYRAKIGGLQFY